MERCTGRNEKGDLTLCGKQVYGNNPNVYNAISLLEDYEKTGLAPDEIPHWIPVSKRLPDPGERVLMCVGDTVFEGHVNQRGEWDRYDNIMGTVEELFGAPVTY